MLLTGRPQKMFKYSKLFTVRLFHIVHSPSTLNAPKAHSPPPSQSLKMKQKENYEKKKVTPQLSSPSRRLTERLARGDKTQPGPAVLAAGYDSSKCLPCGQEIFGTYLFSNFGLLVSPQLTTRP